MKLKTLLVLLLAGIWGVGSWWWYTCKIKGYCDSSPGLTALMAGAGVTIPSPAVQEDEASEETGFDVNQEQLAQAETDSGIAGQGESDDAEQNVADQADETDGAGTGAALEDPGGQEAGAQDAENTAAPLGGDEELVETDETSEAVIAAVDGTDAEPEAGNEIDAGGGESITEEADADAKPVEDADEMADTPDQEQGSTEGEDAGSQSQEQAGAETDIADDAEVPTEAMPTETEASELTDNATEDATEDAAPVVSDIAQQDTDQDGLVDDLEDELGMDRENADSDGDGLEDEIEVGPLDNPVDTDGDGIIDALDEDDDGDGDLTIDEMADPDGDGNPADARDSNNDGLADYLDQDVNSATRDDDGDGLQNGREQALGTNPALTDSDGDGLSDQFEAVDERDTDGDGVIDALDPDDDGDGVMTVMENADPNGDGDPADAQDSNDNGKPDYLDTDNVPAELPDVEALSSQGQAAQEGDNASDAAQDTDESGDAAGQEQGSAQNEAVDAGDSAEAADSGAADDAGAATAGGQIEPARLYFAFRSAEPELADSVADYIDLVIQQLKDNPDVKIRLIGHTDSVGRAADNRELGMQRAEQVRAILVRRGVPEDQIEVGSKGEAEPIADNATEAGRQKNRRVELKPVN